MVCFSGRNEQAALLEWEVLALIDIFIIQYLGVVGIQIVALGVESFISGF